MNVPIGIGHVCGAASLECFERLLVGLEAVCSEPRNDAVVVGFAEVQGEMHVRTAACACDSNDRTPESDAC